MRIDGKITTIATVAIVLLLAVAFRLVTLLPYPIGLYNYVDSPNGRYRAIVSNLKEMDFFGTERNFYQLRVEPALTNYPDQVLFRLDVPEEHIPDGLDLTSREALNRAIRWSPDSVSVKFKVGLREAETVVPF